MFISDGHHSKSEFPGSALQKLEPPPCFQAVLTGIHFVFLSYEFQSRMTVFLLKAQQFIDSFRFLVHNFDKRKLKASEGI